MARYAFVFFTQVIVYTPPGCRISGRGLLTQLHPFCIYIHKKPLPLYDLAPPCGAFQRRPRVWKPFLDITDDDLRNSLDVNVVAAFAFSREVITEFQKLGFEDSNEGGQGGSRKRGTLLFTGATASVRGNVTTSAFAAGKHGLRALAQSLAKEFGKQNIHVRRFALPKYFLRLPVTIWQQIAHVCHKYISSVILVLILHL